MNKAPNPGRGRGASCDGDRDILLFPKEIVNSLESEALGLSHGIIKLEIHIRDGKPVRYVLTRERSILHETLTLGDRTEADRMSKGAEL